MTVTLRTLTANDTEALEQVRQYFRNYAAWLGVDLSYQNFDQEMASLPGAYAPPQGRLFFAEVDGRPAGCVGVRPLPDSDGVCEMKRLYVEPEERGHGVGAALALAAIKAAKEIGYRKLMIDTLPNMRMAVKLYRELGFTEAPNYYQTPVEGTMFMALDLDNWSEEEVRSENLSHLFDFNRAWARQMSEVDPTYFDKLAKIQTPEFLWIGCSDSRVPANQIVGLLPGEVFVHRNVANLVLHTDMNCLSVIQYAVDVLKVKHIMVVGHYGCGGVLAALQKARVGLVDFWLDNVKRVHDKYLEQVNSLPEDQRHDRLCELNVLEQVSSLCNTPVVKDAWARGQDLTVHGWVYGLKDGLVHDLGITVDCPQDLHTRYDAALKALECRDC
ncbi:carbonate dehydratase [Dechloromonas sp. XY25]|uniref:carbonic anhydrase n=1 Tax=Dechloromonas hankyongensis TaxID=2908002 RepID=A0ABS9JYD7_9RHOO|nr:carbonate dehydratase [Dechloromonas hankyongensis]MCG2575920.1 carbonate dehydratase [Dechloromonas hankyongensis]